MLIQILLQDTALMFRKLKYRRTFYSKRLKNYNKMILFNNIIHKTNKENLSSNKISSKFLIKNSQQALKDTHLLICLQNSISKKVYY